MRQWLLKFTSSNLTNMEVAAELINLLKTRHHKVITPINLIVDLSLKTLINRWRTHSLLRISTILYRELLLISLISIQYRLGNRTKALVYSHQIWWAILLQLPQLVVQQSQIFSFSQVRKTADALEKPRILKQSAKTSSS